MRNRASRLSKSPKLYLSDAGLASYLAGLRGVTAPADAPFWGAIFETYVAHNHLGILDSTWPEARLYYWGVQGGTRWTLSWRRAVAEQPTKWAPRWDDRDLSGLKAFLAATPHCQAAVLAYNGTRAVRLGDRLWVLPVSLLLS